MVDRAGLEPATSRNLDKSFAKRVIFQLIYRPTIKQLSVRLKRFFNKNYLSLSR